MKKKNKISSTKANYNEDLVRIIKIGAIVIVSFAIIYLVTAIVTGEIKLGKKKETAEVEIQNEKRLAGETFEIKDTEYMVLYYDFDHMDSALYEMIYSNYKSLSKNEKLYIVDLASGFNKKYVVSDNNVTNPNVTNISELKVKSPTLIRIKDKKVIKYLETKDSIKTYFSEIK